jgi:hypothetical protein
MTKVIFGAACAVAVLVSAWSPAAAQASDIEQTFEAPLSQLDLDNVRGLGAAGTGSGVPEPNPVEALFGVVGGFIPGGPIVSNAQASVAPPLQQAFATVSNVLKTRHDTVKNAIGNIR